MKIIGLELYCPVCQHEERYEDGETHPSYGHNVECPKCHQAMMSRSTFITCDCGATVYLGGFTNECDGCGKLYNSFGNELRPRSEWEEDY